MARQPHRDRSCPDRGLPCPGRGTDEGLDLQAQLEGIKNDSIFQRSLEIEAMVPVFLQSILDARGSPDQTLTGRAAVLIGPRVANEIRFVETAPGFSIGSTVLGTITVMSSSAIAVRAFWQGYLLGSAGLLSLGDVIAGTAAWTISIFAFAFRSSNSFFKFCCCTCCCNAGLT